MTPAAALRTERDDADRKIVELAGTLTLEHEQRVVAERASCAIRQEIARLLPRLATATNSIQQTGRFE